MFDDILGPYVPRQKKDEPQAIEPREGPDSPLSGIKGRSKMQANPDPDYDEQMQGSWDTGGAPVRKAWNTGNRPKGVWRT